MAIPVTHALAQDQRSAMRKAREMQDQENHGATTLITQDRTSEPNYMIYVYNILALEHIIEQPPLFPRFHIHPCEKGQKFSFTVLPAFVNEVYQRAGTTEISYKQVDGRKCATSLLNPAAFPGIRWEGQLTNWDTDDQYGNNLNALGVFWSLTRPDEKEKLEEEIKLFRERATQTMNEYVRRAEELHAAGELKLISPRMHFAMDYLGKSAVWHMSLKHMITCPNCGESVQEGIAYHRNAFGEKCIIDMEKYLKSVVVERPRRVIAEEEDTDAEVPVATAPKKKAARKTA